MSSSSERMYMVSKNGTVMYEVTTTARASSSSPGSGIRERNHPDRKARHYCGHEAEHGKIEGAADFRVLRLPHDLLCADHCAWHTCRNRFPARDPWGY